MEKHSQGEWRRWGLVRPLRAACGVVCARVCVHARTCCSVWACVWKKKIVDVGRIDSEGCAPWGAAVFVPHICHPRMPQKVCVFTSVCGRVCAVTIWAEHQGHAWTARWASPLLICPAPSPHQGRSTPRQGQHCHPCNTNSGGRHWLSIIDGSWL